MLLQAAEEEFAPALLYNSRMTNSPVTIVSNASPSPPKEVSAAERRQRWFEVCLVLLVACGGYVIYSLYLLIRGPSAATQISSFRWAGAIVQEVTALLLLRYVLSRRGLRFADLGLCWSLRDVAVGLLVAAVSYPAYGLGYTLIQTVHHWAYGSFVTGPTAKDFFGHPSIMAIPFYLLNPFFEELIVRAYLMTEIIDLTGSSTLAVGLSVAVSFPTIFTTAGAAQLLCLFPSWPLHCITRTHAVRSRSSSRMDSSMLMG